MGRCPCTCIDVWRATAGKFSAYHTFCTNLAKANVDIRTAQRLMGHSNIQMTANIYTHVDNSQIQVAADKINAFFAAQEFFRSKENRDQFLKG